MCYAVFDMLLSAQAHIAKETLNCFGIWQLFPCVFATSSLRHSYIFEAKRIIFVTGMLCGGYCLVINGIP